MSKTGLVLSGGGAKGAYQVGVMRALLEMGIHIDMISGASIGALNGAILASAPNIQTGTDRLSELWYRLSEEKPLQIDKESIVGSATYLALLIASGLRVATPAGRVFSVAVLATKMPWFKMLLDKAKEMKFPVDKVLNVSDTLNKEKSLFSDKPLQDLMAELLDIDQLQHSIPLYVSVFKQEGILNSAKTVLAAECLGIENKDSEFLHIQSLPIEQQKEALLASAAIPLLFQSRKGADGHVLTDGGQGGWIKAQGNTPITPLVDAGCDYVVVTHLNHGTLWHRHDFPDTTCIEIRPHPSLELGLSAMLDFSKEKIQQLIEYGYEDTMKSLSTIKETLQEINKKRMAVHEMEKGIERLEQATKKMDDTMSSLLGKDND